MREVWCVREVWWCVRVDGVCMVGVRGAGVVCEGV